MLQQPNHKTNITLRYSTVMFMKDVVTHFIRCDHKIPFQLKDGWLVRFYGVCTHYDNQPTENWWWFSHRKYGNWLMGNVSLTPVWDATAALKFIVKVYESQLGESGWRYDIWGSPKYIYTPSNQAWIQNSDSTQWFPVVRGV